MIAATSARFLMNNMIEKLETSDFNPTMVANKTFESILEQVRTSNLNFQLQISPFSALISLKKSPVKDISGRPIPPQKPSFSHPSEPDFAALASKNLKLEADLISLRKDYIICVEDCQEAHRKVKVLESQPAAKEIKKETDIALHAELDEKNCMLETLNFKIEQLEDETKDKDLKIINLKENINDHRLANEKTTEISKKLNKEMSNLRITFGKEKKSILKNHKTQIKYWRNELGEETKLKIKLEEKLSETAETPLNLSADMFGVKELLKPVPLSESSTSTSDETLCSICATPIPNFVPKFFDGEQFNPACDNCDDSSWLSDSSSDASQAVPIPITPRGFDNRPTSTSAKRSSSSSKCSHRQQCILRQPFPPPLPAALTPIVNEYSQYHKKTMAGELDWGSTCWYCMRIDYEKYGCDSCVWIKCFGELHGYPDVAPHDYKDYL